MARNDPRPGRPPRLAGIEGMRGVAASAVLVYHVWLYAAPGGVPAPTGQLNRLFANLLAGVTLFFVLSGFLLFRPYVASALRGTPAPSLAGYLRNRALRILPAYWVVLLAVALVLHRVLLERPQQLLANMLFLQDYVPAYMPVRNGGQGIVPAWSLAIEVVFYLLVPILGGLAIRRSRRRGRASTAAALAPAALLVALGFASKIVLRVAGLGPVWTAGFPVHADWFAAGMTLAVLRVLWEDGRLRPPRWAAPSALLAAAALAGLATHLYARGVLNDVEYQTPIALAALLVLGAIVLGGERSRLTRLLSTRPFVVAGLWSYSVFLWHDPLLRGLRAHGLTRPGLAGFAFNLVLVAAITAVLSALTYRYVERPALARKRPWQRTAPAPVAAAPRPERGAYAA